MAEKLVDQLRLMAERFPDEQGYRNLDTGAGLTFREWDAESNRFARALVGAGIGKGNRVALYVGNDDALRWVVAYAGIHKAGAVVVPTNTRLTAGELRMIWGHAGISGAVVSPALQATFDEGVPDGVDVLVTTDDGSWKGSLADDDSPFQVEVDDDDLADIMYTSGTTGLPKGVATRHCNVAMIPNTEPEWSGVGWIHSSPLFTFAGIGFIYNPMKMGMVSLYQPKFDAGRWIEHVERERPQFAFLVPAMTQLIVNHEAFESADLSSLVLVSIGSAPLPFEVLRRMQEKVPGASVSNSYGMTEAGAAYCVMPPGESLKRKGSVGMPLPPAEIKIVGEDGEPVATGEQGELMIRNPGRPREYYNDPDATAAVWEPDGWLHTGDIASLDDDGFLYIVGRMKDVIIRGGNNIHASDVEDVLHEHPAVLEVAVIGVRHEVLGEDLAAVVVLKDDSSADAAALEAFCRERLADYKVPRRYEFTDELPRNATGKVLKRDLVARYSEEEDA